MRVSIQLEKFKKGQVFFPRQAPWLAALVNELLAFPTAATMTSSMHSSKPWPSLPVLVPRQPKGLGELRQRPLLGSTMGLLGGTD